MIDNNIQKLINEIADQCIDKCLTMATAESVTSGTIQYLLSQADQCTLFYQGGVTAYNNEQKKQLLKIPHAVTDVNYAVNPQVAQRMAMASAVLFKADIGIGITGFAVNDELCDQPYAYLSICHRTHIISEAQLVLRPNEKYKNQLYYAVESIILIKSTLNQL